MRERIITDTLFVSDMDGTLLTPDSTISTRTAEIITDLSKRGAAITVATARTPATVEPLLARTRTNLPAIVMTGAAMWLRDRQRYSDEHLIARDRTELIDRAFARANVVPFIYIMGEDEFLRVYHAGKTMTRAEQKFVDERQHLKLKRFYLNAEPTDEQQSRRILNFAMGTLAQTEQAADELSGVDGISVSCYRDTYNRDLGLLEVFAGNVSKAAAVSELKRKTGAKRLVVYGDNLNDLPMMEVADVAVAVENALPEVKERADVVIGPNTDDSVAKHIQKEF